jgi:hypothetical protein
LPPPARGVAGGSVWRPVAGDALGDTVGAATGPAPVDGGDFWTADAHADPKIARDSTSVETLRIVM